MKSRLLICLILVFVLSASLVSQAQNPDTTVEDDNDLNVLVESLTFADLEFETEELRDPIDSVRYRFHLPVDWVIEDAATLQLRLDVASSGENASDALLRVFVNDNLADSLVVNAETTAVETIDIPVDYLIPYLEDGRHEIRLVLDASDYCRSADTFIAVVDDDSSVEFTYRPERTTPDFRQFPRPFVQDSFIPDRAMIVIPDDASQVTLDAALTTAAAFGEWSDGNLQLTLRQASDVTPDDRASNDLILVGQAGDIPLDDVTLDFPVVDGAFDGFDHDTDDGILQLARSTTDPGQTILLVSGESDAGLQKAAQALSYGSIVPYDAPNLSVIRQVTPLRDRFDPGLDISFADAGYEDFTADTGVMTFYYLFDLPAGNRITDGNLILQFSHSELLDFDNSGLTVRLNGEPVTSVALSEETTGAARQQIQLPASAFRAGLNEIAIDVQLFPQGECLDEDSNLIWLRIDNQSALSLSVDNEVRESERITTLNRYPDPFTFTPALESTAFVLPSQSTTGEWEAAAQIAFSLGARTFGQLIDISVALDDTASEELLNNYHLILVGTQDHPFVPVLESAVTEAEENPTIRQEDAQLREIRFEVATPSNIGYLQIHESPWNAERVVLSALADTMTGLQNATTALTTPETRRRMNGNFALVSDSQVIADTTVQFNDDPANEPIQVISDEPDVFNFDNTTRLAIFGLVAAGLLLIVIIVVGLVYRTMRRE